MKCSDLFFEKYFMKVYFIKPTIQTYCIILFLICEVKNENIFQLLFQVKRKDKINNKILLYKDKFIYYFILPVKD